MNRIFAISEANASTSVSVTKTTLIERKNNGLMNLKRLLLFFFSYRQFVCAAFCVGGAFLLNFHTFTFRMVA